MGLGKHHTGNLLLSPSKELLFSASGSTNSASWSLIFANLSSGDSPPSSWKKGGGDGNEFDWLRQFARVLKFWWKNRLKNVLFDSLTDYSLPVRNKRAFDAEIPPGTLPGHHIVIGGKIVQEEVRDRLKKLFRPR